METKLYLSNAFGWNNESIDKVAICQLRDESRISTDTCPKAQLIKSGSIRWQANILKFAGYVPIVNFGAGLAAMVFAENDPSLRPNHKTWWTVRGILMIITGPLLLLVDLVKHVFDRYAVSKYNRENVAKIEQFNTSHRHTIPAWTGHPVQCLRA